MANDFSIGIEEEYFLVDAQTKRVPPNVPEVVLRRRQGGDRRPGLRPNSCSRRSR